MDDEHMGPACAETKTRVLDVMGTADAQDWFTVLNEIVNASMPDGSKVVEKMFIESAFHKLPTEIRNEVSGMLVSHTPLDHAVWQYPDTEEKPKK